MKKKAPPAKRKPRPQSRIRKPNMKAEGRCVKSTCRLILSQGGRSMCRKIISAGNVMTLMLVLTGMTYAQNSLQIIDASAPRGADATVEIRGSLLRFTLSAA